MRNAQDILQHTNQHPADLFVEPVCIPAYRSTQRSSCITQHSNTSAALQQHSSNSIQFHNDPAASRSTPILQQHYSSTPATASSFTTIQQPRQHTNTQILSSKPPPSTRLSIQINIQQPCAVPSISNSTASRVPNIQRPNSLTQYSSVATRLST
jgi:hypothetical protein